MEWVYKKGIGYREHKDKLKGLQIPTCGQININGNPLTLLNAAEKTSVQAAINSIQTKLDALIEALTTANA